MYNSIKGAFFSLFLRLQYKYISQVSASAAISKWVHLHKVQHWYLLDLERFKKISLVCVLISCQRNVNKDQIPFESDFRCSIQITTESLKFREKLVKTQVLEQKIYRENEKKALYGKRSSAYGGANKKVEKKLVKTQLTKKVEKKTCHNVANEKIRKQKLNKYVKLPLNHGKKKKSCICHFYKKICFNLTKESTSSRREEKKSALI